ncbi:MAG: hypothetical protein OXH52_09155 [Gammaproteobacteria bacterium]|nr:hypothetical protein [Gammaproteobacteria bacterium]
MRDAVLSVLVGVLLFAAPVAAQETVIWEATLTIETDSFGNFGYDRLNGNTQGSLSPNTFPYNGIAHTTTRLIVVPKDGSDPRSLDTVNWFVEGDFAFGDDARRMTFWWGDIAMVFVYRVRVLSE